MYIKSEILKDIGAYALVLNKLYYLVNGKIFLEKKELATINDTCSFYQFYNKLLVITDEDATGFLIDNNAVICSKNTHIVIA